MSPLQALAAGLLLSCWLAGPTGAVNVKQPVITGLTVVPEQAAVLQQIKDYFNLTLTADLGWKQPWSCVNTTGVVCDAQGKVIRLILSGMPSVGCWGLPLDPVTASPINCPLPFKLQKPIPPVMGNLTTLTMLDLSGNLISGSIPDALFNLTNLIWLKLDTNQYARSASIPAAISRLVKLQQLDLGYTQQLSQQLPLTIASLSTLTYLNLYMAGLTGTLQPELGNLTALKFFALSGNRLRGSIPMEYSSLTNLENLWLQQNALTGPIPAYLGTFTNLVQLRLKGNLLEGPVPASLGNLHKLQFLDLSYNEGLTGPLPPSLSQLANILPPNSSINLGNSWILFTNTSTTCPTPTRSACVGPPPVNTTSEFCKWACSEFCTACAAENYVAANTPAFPAGDQPIIAVSPPSPPAPTPPEVSPPADPGAGMSTVPPPATEGTAPPPPSGAASTAAPFSSILAGAALAIMLLI